jgi:hypothetical protein
MDQRASSISTGVARDLPRAGGERVGSIFMFTCANAGVLVRGVPSGRAAPCPRRAASRSGGARPGSAALSPQDLARTPVDRDQGRRDGARRRSGGVGRGGRLGRSAAAAAIWARNSEWMERPRRASRASGEPRDTRDGLLLALLRRVGGLSLNRRRARFRHGLVLRAAGLAGDGDRSVSCSRREHEEASGPGAARSAGLEPSVLLDGDPFVERALVIRTRTERRRAIASPRDHDLRPFCASWRSRPRPRTCHSRGSRGSSAREIGNSWEIVDPSTIEHVIDVLRGVDLPGSALPVSA